MAEFAASIIGIVSAGTKVALVLSQLSADVGSAGHEARMIGGEIRSFCSVLKTLGETIEQIETSPRYAHCSEMIKDMTEDSLQMFTEILNAVDKLKKMENKKIPENIDYHSISGLATEARGKLAQFLERNDLHAVNSEVTGAMGGVEEAKASRLTSRNRSLQDEPDVDAEYVEYG